MFFARIAPLTPIPLPQNQILTYYTSLKLKKGALVNIPLRKKITYGVVMDSSPIAPKNKIEIKRANYQLKNISKIVYRQPILTEQQIGLAIWMSRYYWTPLTTIIKKMLPPLNQIENLKNKKFKRDKKVKQTLILAPQISQIPAIIEQLKIKNKKDISIITNKLTDKQRLEEWLKIKSGKTKFIIGARSAILAPFSNLSKIIIENAENEHYKSSQQQPRFDARKTALWISQSTGVKLILKSDLPSAELFYLSKNNAPTRLLNANQNPIAPNAISNNRKNKSPNITFSFKHPLPSAMPSPIIIDIREELKQKNFSIFSAKLKDDLKQFLSQKKQIILFAGRRGAASLIICKDCGNIIKCPNCDTPLAYHLTTNKKDEKNFSNLICHHCHQQEKPPSKCPICQSYQIRFSGIGAEKIELEIKKIFPQKRISRLDGDIPITKRKNIIQEFQKKQIDILICTQLLLNQRKQMASLTGVISIDALLYLPDFRSQEKVFKLISKLKMLTSETLLIQTKSPNNYAIKFGAIGDYKSFIQEELETRKEFNYPPFAQIIKLTYRHKNKKIAENEAIKLKIILEDIIKKKTTDKIEIFDAAPAFIAKKINQYYFNIIIKLPISPDNKDEIANINPLPPEIKYELLKLVPPNWIVDIDPESLL